MLRSVTGVGAMPASPDGLVAICMNGEIVYVSLDGGPQPAPDDAPSDPCPYFGFGSGSAAPTPSALPVASVERALAPSPAPAVAPFFAAPAAYAPRAPPFFA